MSNSTNKQLAKEHSLDIPHISCIEFPLKVKNVDKAFNMVGGKEKIIQSCLDNQIPLELRLTKNLYEHPINAKTNANEHLLIKISIPKREYKENNFNIQKTLQNLHSNGKKNVHITPIAIINKTFRFREMSDFQYQVKNSKFVKQVNESIHDLNFEKIKNLKFEQDTKPWDFDNKQQKLFDLPPPPRFSSIPLPFNYNYKKNALTVVKEGKLVTRNKSIKLHSIIIKYSDPTPQESSKELQSQLETFQSQRENPFYKDILLTLDIIIKLFEEKPIWLRKHLESILPIHLKPLLKFALPQISYTFTKGPWRQSYIKFGIDPRILPNLRNYQTEVFRIPNFRTNIPKGFMTDIPNSTPSVFKFDGQQLPMSLTFQLENLIDTDVVILLSKAIINKECDFYDGWFDKLTMFKLRRLMRYKLKMVVDGLTMNSDKLHHILHNLQLQEGKDNEDDEEDDEDEGNDQNDDDNDEDNDDDEFEDYELDLKNANYDEILKYIGRFNGKGAEKLKELSNVLKQDDIDI
ncbi:Transcription factor tau subunit [Wickerhamomyces ciferrii]|uniref:Transcription factor tau subunit n=1 Tax=Wickerhamomyces ciferrii (strain ATCC 14091 / BCRC 22168 / CBS 111 / JCM 3599 / NBRC 0793 / NRRL Y-1031 F-60-10) TaxID=1206466 RepID=K0KUY6_WICCF|nr:Transcription factor tau subunit [Wickerhamomyces ciferrii]CCH45239.1 Transcription factor tau subunit [Wickerhamomyces ciferrii]